MVLTRDTFFFLFLHINRDHIKIELHLVSYKIKEILSMKILQNKKIFIQKKNKTNDILRERGEGRTKK